LSFKEYFGVGKVSQTASEKQEQGGGISEDLRKHMAEK
jgi:hypothetical protein